MRETLIRILKHGLPAALTLAVIGYFMSDFAGAWVNAPNDSRPRGDSKVEHRGRGDENDISAEMKRKLPYTMAAWGFGIVVLFELVAAFWRVPQQKNKQQQVHGLPRESEVELLLNQLLVRSQADKQARSRESGTHPEMHRRPPGTDESHSDLEIR